MRLQRRMKLTFQKVRSKNKIKQPMKFQYQQLENIIKEKMISPQETVQSEVKSEEQTKKETTDQKKRLVILRGISGSGKSTLAKALLEEEPRGVVYSTDDFFINKETGEYQFNGAAIGRAHAWNQRRAEKAMQEGIPLVIIDNTNTQKWEAKPYVEFGLKYNYEIEFKEPTTPWAKNAEELAKKNVHGVPIEAIQRMLDRWETDFTIENILKSKPPRRKKKKPFTKKF